MNQFTQRHYQTLLAYLKDGLRSGELTNDTKLPSEAALAECLSFSVPSLHEAMQLLEMFGLVTQDIDGGYRMSHDVGRGFTDLLALFLLMENLSYPDVIRMRRGIELQSVPAIVENITETEKQTLYYCIVRMMSGARGDRRADEEFHNVLVSASRDKLADGFNRALVQFTGPTGRIAPSGEYELDGWEDLMQLHMQVYQAIAAGDAARTADAINAHYDHLLQAYEKSRGK